LGRRTEEVGVWTEWRFILREGDVFEVKGILSKIIRHDNRASRSQRKTIAVKIINFPEHPSRILRILHRKCFKKALW
jgi:hypothetical protein